MFADVLFSAKTFIMLYRMVIFHPLFAIEVVAATRRALHVGRTKLGEFLLNHAVVTSTARASVFMHRRPLRFPWTKRPYCLVYDNTRSKLSPTELRDDCAGDALGQRFQFVSVQLNSGEDGTDAIRVTRWL